MNRFKNAQQIAPYFNSIAKYEKKPHVYILQEREFIRVDEHTYKIGQTEEIHKRFGTYSKASDLKYIMPVKNCLMVETVAKLRFKVIFKHRPDYGAEYFEGDITLMIIEMDRIIAQCLLTENVKPLIFMCRIFKPLPVIPTKPKRFNFSKKLPTLQINSTQQTSIKHLTTLCNPLLQWTQKSSKQCPKCYRIFSKTNAVTKHLVKKTPCDLKCILCGKQLKSITEYHQHQKDHL